MDQLSAELRKTLGNVRGRTFTVRRSPFAVRAAGPKGAQPGYRGSAYPKWGMRTVSVCSRFGKRQNGTLLLRGLAISALNAVSRRDNIDRSLARSAWESVPRKNRPVGYGVIGRSESQRCFSSRCAPCFGFSIPIRNFVTPISNRCAHLHESDRTLRDAFSPAPLGHNPKSLSAFVERSDLLILTKS
jgi:hypothetical protein